VEEAKSATSSQNGMETKILVKHLSTHIVEM
jgi:hypothetical protein